MNEYIQEKIQNFKKFCKQASADSGYSLDETDDYEELVKKYTEDMEEAYNRGVEDSIAVYKDKSEYDYHEIIDSLTKLTNK